MDEPQDDSDEHAPASALIALPPDALARVCAYLETRAARRLHASGREAIHSMATPKSSMLVLM